MPAGFYNGEIMFADNVRFDGDNQPGQVTADGQLLIGSTVAPNIRVATLASGDGSVTITNGNGTIDLSASGGGGSIDTIAGDTGSITGANVTIYANNAANNSGATVKFVNSGTTSTLNVTDVLTNTIIGQSAGNISASGTANIGFGFRALQNFTSGQRNCAIGYEAMQLTTSGGLNIGIGTFALKNVNGSDNVAIGDSALGSYTGSGNTAVGSSALTSTSGSGNTALGYLAGRSITSGTNNVAVGYIAMVNSGAGSNNVGIGYQALQNCTGNTNTAVGYNAGSSYNTTETGNLLLGNVAGTASESNVTRIGNAQTTCYIAGIAGVTVANQQNVVINSSTGQLGTIAGNPIQQATITLTSAQIKTLNATPVQIIAAQGAGTIIAIDSVVTKFIYGGSNVFVAGAAQAISLAYNTAPINTILLTSPLVNSATSYQIDSQLSAGNSYSTAAIENVAVTAYNPIATEISGNAANDNTITIVVKYYVVTI